MSKQKIYYLMDLNYRAFWHLLAGDKPPSSLKYPKLGLMYISVHKPESVGRTADYILNKYYPLAKYHKEELNKLQRNYDFVWRLGRLRN